MPGRCGLGSIKQRSELEGCNCRRIRDLLAGADNTKHFRRVDSNESCCEQQQQHDCTSCCEESKKMIFEESRKEMMEEGKEGMEARVDKGNSQLGKEQLG